MSQVPQVGPASVGLRMAADRLIRVGEVAALVGVSKAALYKYIREQRFIRPIKLSRRAAVWRVSDVERWIAAQAASTAPAGKGEKS